VTGAGSTTMSNTDDRWIGEVDDRCCDITELL
jgi:hypothetical protein